MSLFYKWVVEVVNFFIFVVGFSFFEVLDLIELDFDVWCDLSKFDFFEELFVEDSINNSLVQL